MLLSILCVFIPSTVGLDWRRACVDAWLGVPHPDICVLSQSSLLITKLTTMSFHPDSVDEQDYTVTLHVIKTKKINSHRSLALCLYAGVCTRVPRGYKLL